MTKEEAMQAWKCMRSEIDNENWLFVGTINPQMVDMAIEALSAEAKWIPCSEKLPRNDGCVLVTIDDGIEFGKYEDGEWSIWVCEHWDKWDAKGTIAWMPLPEPWKGEENG